MTLQKTDRPLLEVQELVVDFSRTGRRRGKSSELAVDAVSFDIEPNESVALVGESGSGKTTIARCVMGLQRPTSGRISFRGMGLAPDVRKRSPDIRRDVQPIFQDPGSSLNPRRTIWENVRLPQRFMGKTSSSVEYESISGALARVGLEGYAERYPHEISGGQKQRVAIARALITRPSLLIADEPTSALDVSVQTQILHLLLEIREEFGLAILFISHDLAVVRHISDRVVVLKGGEVQEHASTRDLFERPSSPYTRRLLDAIPVLP